MEMEKQKLDTILDLHKTRKEIANGSYIHTRNSRWTTQQKRRIQTISLDAIIHGTDNSIGNGWTVDVIAQTI